MISKEAIQKAKVIAVLFLGYTKYNDYKEAFDNSCEEDEKLIEEDIEYVFDHLGLDLSEIEKMDNLLNEEGQTKD